MEDKIRKLFDYQKYENNPNLKIVISKCLNEEESNELMDDELVFATGGKKDDTLTSEEKENIKNAVLDYYDQHRLGFNVVTPMTYDIYKIIFSSFFMGSIEYDIYLQADNTKLGSDSVNVD